MGQGKIITDVRIHPHKLSPPGELRPVLQADVVVAFLLLLPVLTLADVIFFRAQSGKLSTVISSTFRRRAAAATPTPP
jgi:hypothetical protein